MMEPMAGTKFSRKASKPQSTGKSTPNRASQSATAKPVARLTELLMAM